MKDFVVETARPAEDSEAIAAFDAALFPDSPFPRMVVRQYLDLFFALSLVARRPGGIDLMGYSITGVSAGGVGWLLSIGTLPEFRGKGIASSLLRNTRERLVERRVAEWRLTLDPENYPARRVFGENGFMELRREQAYFGEGEDRIVMKGGVS